MLANSCSFTRPAWRNNSSICRVCWLYGAAQTVPAHCICPGHNLTALVQSHHSHRVTSSSNRQVFSAKTEERHSERAAGGSCRARYFSQELVKTSNIWRLKERPTDLTLQSCNAVRRTVDRSWWRQKPELEEWIPVQSWVSSILSPSGWKPSSLYTQHLNDCSGHVSLLSLYTSRLTTDSF